jgi:hypothetical protein
MGVDLRVRASPCERACVAFLPECQVTGVVTFVLCSAMPLRSPAGCELAWVSVRFPARLSVDRPHGQRRQAGTSGWCTLVTPDPD